jgi:hypothetical protein
MRFIIKTQNSDGVPSSWEISDFEGRKGVSINDVTRLYSTFKVGKRRKIKRLRLTKRVSPCESCGSHTYVSGKIGDKEFSKEIY